MKDLDTIVVTSTIGQALDKKRGLTARFIITTREENPSSNVIRLYIKRTLNGLFLNLPISNISKTVVYATSDCLPDVLPSFVFKYKNRQIKWVQIIHHLYLSPFQRKGKSFLTNTLGFLFKRVSFFFNHLLEYIEDYDIVIGSRNLSGSLVKRKPMRKFISWVLSLINSIFLNLNIKDTQCGFKLFNYSCRSLFESLTIHSSAFDIELLYIARKINLKIKEIPINWIDSGFSNFNHIVVVGRFFRDLLKIKKNDLKGVYPISPDKYIS